MSALLGARADWYLMRGSGFVVLALLTLTACLGIANVTRTGRSTLTRTVATLVHRNASLLAVVFLAVHVATAVADRYVSVPLVSAVVPGASGYDPLWVGLGALSLDLVAAVVATSLLRHRLPPAAWRAVHWLTYLSVPTALVHAIGSGSGAGADTGTAWSTGIYLAVGVAFGAAVAYRLGRGRRSTPLVRQRPAPRYAATAAAPPRPVPVHRPAARAGTAPRSHR